MTQQEKVLPSGRVILREKQKFFRKEEKKTFYTLYTYSIIYCYFFATLRVLPTLAHM